MEAPKSLEPKRETAFRMTVRTVTGIRNMKPPMVGVFILAMCDSGTSMRIILPMRKVLRKRMNGSPQMTLRRKAIPPMAMAREVLWVIALPPAGR